MPDGLVVLDKPAGWTSHDVVARARRLLGTRKVGHAGTLDPMATGVLVLGVDRGTRLLTYLVGADKEYAATIRLGAATTTDDAEGELLATADAAHLTRAEVTTAVAELTGDIQQVPSAVSAIKVDGRRAYARVRAGEAVDLAARPVTVHRFEVLDLRHDVVPDGRAVADVDVVVHCSSGTYVRALARDLGAGLGVGGHLTALRRTRVGRFGLDVARTLTELERAPSVLPVADAAALSLPVRRLTEAEARALSHGRPIAPDAAGPGGTTTVPVAAVGPDGTLVALVVQDGSRCRPVVVLAPA